ncbi:MAG TPA: hypothetical protein VGC77_20980 [Rhodopseudomonas sp.]|uniref:hypothetical protein n=1 Tax=Rhodopseudomonas sp. TaxID=1078 RepID=UPI002EDA4308
MAVIVAASRAIARPRGKADAAKRRKFIAETLSEAVTHPQMIAGADISPSAAVSVPIGADT